MFDGQYTRFDVEYAHKVNRVALGIAELCLGAQTLMKHVNGKSWRIRSFGDFPEGDDE